MAYKPHRDIRTSKARNRKFGGRCEGCGALLCECSVYQYTDESNAAISANAPYLCAACYAKRYGKRIKTPLDYYREYLIWRLHRLRSYLGDPLKVDAIDLLIRIINEIG